MIKNIVKIVYWICLLILVWPEVFYSYSDTAHRSLPHNHSFFLYYCFIFQSILYFLSPIRD